MALDPIQRHPRSSRPGGSMPDPYNGNNNYYPQDNSPTSINNHHRPSSKPIPRQNSPRNVSAPLDPNNMGNMKSRMLSCRRNGASEPSSRVPSPLSSPPHPVAAPNRKPMNSPSPRPGAAPHSDTLVNGSDSSNKSTDNGSSNPSSSETENSNSEEARSQPDREDQASSEKETDIEKEKNLPIPKELKSVNQPLTNLHYSCYQAHRSLAMSRNIYYPVPCMTCHTVDREVRWKCTFCCLRVCASCVEGLRACQRRSLKEFLGTLSA